MKSFWKPQWKRILALGIGYTIIFSVLYSMGYTILTWQYWVILIAVFYIGVVNSVGWK